MNKPNEPDAEYRFPDSEDTDFVEDEELSDWQAEFRALKEEWDKEKPRYDARTGRMYKPKPKPKPQPITPSEEARRARRGITPPTPRPPMDPVPKVPLTEADMQLLQEVGNAYVRLLTKLVSEKKMPKSTVDRFSEFERIIEFVLGAQGGINA